MGTYFNPGNESFKKALKGKIYVDKTGLLEILNDMVCAEANCIALSHARRFGKSQAAGMIKAYYSKGCDSRELFSKFEIANKPSFEEHLNKYNVIYLDMSLFTNLPEDMNVVELVMSTLHRELKEDYPDIPDISNPIGVILHVYAKSHTQFVIIIDEWDCVIRNFSHRPDMVHKYIRFLHSLFKSEESKQFLALGYITGILPIKQTRDESGLNNFREYTMISSKNFTPYFGFTEDEVKALCKEYNMDFETVKLWYNGYLITTFRFFR